MAAGAACDLYRIFSASVLGYLGQILAPPDDPFSEERKLIHYIFKLPPNVFASIPFRDLRDVVGFGLPSLKHSFIAAKARFYFSYKSEVDGWYASLVSALDSSMLIVMTGRFLLLPIGIRLPLFTTSGTIGDIPILPPPLP